MTLHEVSVHGRLTFVSRNKTIQLICNSEKLISDLAWQVSRDENLSMSAYIRRLIISDLKRREILTQDMVDEIL
jgi:hypothetical protein